MRRHAVRADFEWTSDLTGKEFHLLWRGRLGTGALEHAIAKACREFTRAEHPPIRAKGTRAHYNRRRAGR